MPTTSVANSSKSAKSPKKPVACIALYGVDRCGHGTITVLADGRMLGTGEPIEGRSATQAIWFAADELRRILSDEEQRGATVIISRDFDLPGREGSSTAVVPLAHVPAFGALQWEHPPVGCNCVE